MKNLVFLFAVLISNGLFSQLKREVIYRLNAHEVVYENEYTVLISMDNSRKFSAMIKDTLRNSYRLVFNGNTVGTFPANDYGYPLATVKNIDLNKPQGYSHITYREKLRDINIEGKKINNLENAYFVSYDDNSQNNDYCYNLLGEVYLNKNGNSFSIEGKKFYKIHGENVLWIEDYEWVYPRYSNASLWWNSNFLGVFNIRGGDYDPLIHVDENGYAFVFSKNNEDYINFNGNVSRLRSKIIDNLKIVGDDYYFMLDNGLYKNNVLVQDFNMDVSEWAVNTRGDVLYTNGQNLYLNALLIEQNQTVSWIRQISIDNSGNISYTYDSKDCSHCYFEVINQNEKEYTSYRISGGAEINSTDGNHELKSKWNYDYVVIDGAPYGNSPALTAWFDNKNKCFYWNSFENNELVLYQFKL